MFCVNLFYDFQDDGTGKPVPYREIELFRSAQALFKRALRKEFSTTAHAPRSPSFRKEDGSGIRRIVLCGFIFSYRMTERVNPFPTESGGFFVLCRYILNGLYAKNPPPSQATVPLFSKGGWFRNSAYCSVRIYF